ncbi:hypothetical protein GWK47_025073 [Chionoecetes opilio]|uniref:Uncharacterized protein n=1 Tax=Chionoecetes opilio TaxID=41210 RepID=A0A8J4XUX6_CHIOP|nr:hypothetical protein GWK47_025073 [Chionoecetes opilio]
MGEKLHGDRLAEHTRRLSESLAYRLRGQIEGQQTAAAAEPPPPPFPTPPPVAAIPQVPEPPRVPQITHEPFIPKPAQVPEPPVAEGYGAAETTPEKLISGTGPSVAEIAGVTTAVELPDETNAESQPDVGVAVRAGSGPTLIQPGGNIPPWSIYAEEAHLMVMRLREEKEQELQQLNQDWREKMEAREQEFSKMSQLSEEEVSSAIKEVEKLFVKASAPQCVRTARRPS